VYTYIIYTILLETIKGTQDDDKLIIYAFLLRDISVGRWVWIELRSVNRKATCTWTKKKENKKLCNYTYAIFLFASTNHTRDRPIIGFVWMETRARLRGIDTNRIHKPKPFYTSLNFNAFASFSYRQTLNARLNAI